MNYDTNRRTFMKAVGAGAIGTSLAGCFDNDTNDYNGDTEPDEVYREIVEPDVDRIAADPTDVPDPVDWDEPRYHEIEMETIEAVAEIEPGVTTRFMTYDGQIPGPMYRVREGDTVNLKFDVPDEYNRDVHNVDFHAVYGPGGGAVDTTLVPGDESAEIEFKADYPGAHIYHCAPGAHDQHISLGMFGTILVEPEDGLPEVDKEFYIGQHELYLDGEAGEEGHHTFDFDASADEDPTYVLFNGEVGAFTEDGYGPLEAEVGDDVRVYWANGGPNLTSGPHPIGNVWSKWYRDGDVLSEPAQYVEGSAQPAGTTAFGEMEMKVPGPIFLVDHALSRVVHKGLLATIEVDGEADPELYDGNPE